MKLILTGILIIISSSAYSQELKYPTKDIREMWYSCSNSIQTNAPQLNLVQRARLCDCYVNYFRKNYTPIEVQTMPDQESKDVGIKLMTICPLTKNVRLQEST